MFPKLFEACEGGAAERLPLQDREPCTLTRLSQDALVGVNGIAHSMRLEPRLVLLVGVEVVEDDVKLAVRKSRGDTVHEVEKLDAATAF